MRTDKKSKIKTSKVREVWLVPYPETVRDWDGDFITKEMFANALGLNLTGELLDDNEHVEAQNEEMEMLQEDENNNISIEEIDCKKMDNDQGHEEMELSFHNETDCLPNEQIIMFDDNIGRKVSFGTSSKVKYCGNFYCSSACYTECTESVCLPAP